MNIIDLLDTVSWRSVNIFVIGWRPFGAFSINNFFLKKSFLIMIHLVELSFEW